MKNKIIINENGIQYNLTEFSQFYKRKHEIDNNNQNMLIRRRCYEK